MGSVKISIDLNVFLGQIPDRHKPLFVSFTGNFNKTFLKKQIGNFQRNQLRNPKSTTIKGFQHGSIAFPFIRT